MELLEEKNQIQEIISNPYKYAAIYARESNTSVPNPIETQKHFCREHARNKNLFIYNEYSELISASSRQYTDRPQFMALLDDAKKGYFKSIIVTRRDRMCRNFEEYIELKNIFKKLNVEILYSNDIELNDKKSYATEFIENIIMGLAEMEPRRIKQRTEAGRNAKIQKQIYDKAPSYGFKYDKYDKTYYKDGAKFKIVQDIFDIFLNNDEVTDHQKLCSKLKDNMETNYKGTESEEYFKLVSNLKPSDIKKILSRPFYAGIQISNAMYRYNMFYVQHNENIVQANEKFFLPFTNIETTVITPE
ncbi:MAG: recombinase family protein [Clostridiaceae bacterium]|nr:recombinase family protein [Clostridiaceae bacterium]